MKSKPLVIVRTQSAGVFAGVLESRDGSEAVVYNARRLWYWSGAGPGLKSMIQFDPAIVAKFTPAI